MARKYPLHPKQWEKLEKRLLNGEKCRELAREFGVPESTIRKRYSMRNKQIQTVANQLVESERNFNELSISAQISARCLADELKSISQHITEGAKLSAMTSSKLHAIANKHAGLINEDAPLEGDTLQAIAALTKVANEASANGISLISLNKSSVAEKDTSDKKIEYEIIK